MLTFHTRGMFVAASFGAWPIGVIVTGRIFDDLQDTEREAILAHERGHFHRFHAWRLLWARLRRKDASELNALRRQFEFEADDFAASQGPECVFGLYVFLHRLPRAYTDSHPGPLERIARLCERHVSGTAQTASSNSA